VHRFYWGRPLLKKELKSKLFNSKIRPKFVLKSADKNSIIQVRHIHRFYWKTAYLKIGAKIDELRGKYKNLFEKSEKCCGHEVIEEITEQRLNPCFLP